MPRAISWFFALMILVTAIPVSAASLSGVDMEETVVIDGNTLHLNGLGLRKKFVVKVYVGALYLSEKSSDPAAILGEDTPRRVVMHFLRGVSKKQLCDAWREGLDNNSPDAGNDVRRNFETLCELMTDVDKGDRLVLTYLPGRGLEVAIGNQIRGTLEGQATADAVLASFIGPEPPSKDFKDGLLGG